MNRLQVKIPAVPVIFTLSWLLSIWMSYWLYANDLLAYLINSDMCDSLYTDLAAGVATPGYLIGWLTIVLTGVLLVRVYKWLQVKLRFLREHGREVVFILLLSLTLIAAALISWSCYV